MRGLAHREQDIARRTSQAAAAATELVTDLAAAVAEQPDLTVEDALCQRLGTLLDQARHAPPDDRTSPPYLAAALVEAAADAVTAAIGQAAAWRAPWQVLTAVADVLPHPDRQAAADTIARLRNESRVLPPAPPDPVIAGPVLWTRDRYGSRFAVTAPIAANDRPQRWYLWDIDACGHEAFTVHSGFYATAEAALAAWQAGVGQPAAAGTELAPVDNPRLVAQLMPTGHGFMSAGGDTAEQLAEYYRSRRLAEALRQAMPWRETPPADLLDAPTAATEFAAWLRTRGPDQQPLPADLDELATELADSWCLNNIGAVYAACSPHRVALSVLHIRNYYLDDFAEQLVALLPDWTSWLAARNATAPELADRCTPYAQGQAHPQITVTGVEPSYLARVLE